MADSITPAQITSLFQTMENDPKMAAQFRALLAIKDENSESPSPKDTRKTEDSVPAPGKNASSSTNKDLDATQRQETTGASDFLSTMHDYTLIRRVKQKENYFVPSAARMMNTLYNMDRIIIKKFKARRAATTMLPIINIEYFALLWSIQTARCLQFAGYLEDVEDQTFLSTFLERYPPETLPIPGPLLPFFKAVTTFRPENPLHKRVSPGFPANALRPAATNGNQVSQNTSNLLFPNVPMIVDTVDRYLKHLYGNDYTEEPTADKIKSLKHAGLNYFPFSKAALTDNEYSTDINIGGFNFVKDYNVWTDVPITAMQTPGLNAPVPCNLDVLKSAASSVEDLANPNASTREYYTTGLQTWLRMTKMNWFAQLLVPMSEYSALWIGSGTLADCSVDGPSAGAHVFRYSDSESAPARTYFPFGSSAAYDLIGHVYTSVASPQIVDERLGAFTQVHVKMASNHWYQPSAASRRNGNVWDIRPIYGPSVEVTSASTVSVALEKFINPRVAM
ncbi:coat protein [Tulasnella partitivirus 1]|nr:coat protein [Tulasnella partitivirus 1]